MKALLKARGLTLRAVERASGVDNAFISRMMRGEKTASVEALARISQALELPADYFSEVRLARVVDALRRDTAALDSVYDQLVLGQSSRADHA
jgi:transcriptional regulator with XRE-family HTH domain